MDVNELRAILQSDFKLWEQAETAVEGNTLVKRIDLPHGIGVYELKFEGVKDAEGRRNAAAIWAAAVRERVDNAIGDEAVTARALQKGPRPVAPASGDVNGNVSDTREPAALLNAEAVPAHDENVQQVGTDPVGQLDELVGRAEWHVAEANRLQREIRALRAYVEVMNASENEEASHQRDDEEGED